MIVGALIPCRKGSTGIPGKNFKDLCGKPLWEWSLDAALASGIFDKIIVSSDGGLSDRILPVPDKVIYDDKRPAHLSTDDAKLDDLLMYSMTKYDDVDIWCLLQPTSPLRTAEDILKAYELFSVTDEKGEHIHESLLSAYNNPVLAWITNAVGIPGDDDHPQPIATYHYTKRPNRQDRKDWFLENGAIYFTRKYILKAFGSRLHGTIAVYEMPPERSIELDTPYDWFLAEHTLRYYNGLG